MKKNSTTAENIKGRAKASLEESLGAVQQALASTPALGPAQRKTRVISAAGAFIAVDPILSMLHTQLAEARANYAQMIQMFGSGDAMAEALAYQMTALERAYVERLALLKRKSKREETSRKPNGIKTEEKTLQDVRLQQLPDEQHHGALWSWAFLLLMSRQTYVRQPYGLVPNAA